MPGDKVGEAGARVFNLLALSLAQSPTHARSTRRCRGKFGESGARVFKLLAGAGQQLEQRTVSERAMLPIKLTRELLYRMLKARYVSLQVNCCLLLLLQHGPDLLLHWAIVPKSNWLAATNAFCRQHIAS